ncbi:hypothetical protein WPS_22360 [Vulcanimicrobium alpinum]|uniref:LysE family translocator n=1 Tax=Vulcanimicrobium alpinum TaxID=3016050 RepID=A0AAN2C9W0_UNVUL|nr:LysE family translocator [Vulcanimicrobium alpinum]BDE06960.1 hypothetical protein WPS_22360 [Vulcanimicrobium alpinum]
MTLHAWLPFAGLALLVSLVPGPAVVAVVSSALRGGFAASLRTNAGVLVGDAVFVAAAVAGLGTLLVASHPLFTAVKWIGIVYLAYLGVRALLDRTPAFEPRPNDAGRAFRLGLATQLANPKVILFFGALLPQFATRRDPSPSSSRSSARRSSRAICWSSRATVRSRTARARCCAPRAQRALRHASPASRCWGPPRASPPNADLGGDRRGDCFDEDVERGAVERVAVTCDRAYANRR